MNIRILHGQDDFGRYDHWLRTHPQSNMWQSLERKMYAEALGKQTRIYVTEEQGEILASALIEIDTTMFGLSVWEIARGPIWGIGNGGPFDTAQNKLVGKILEKIQEDARKEKCLVIFFSPITSLSAYRSSLTAHSSSLTTHHSSLIARPSKRLIHCEATRIVDMTKSEEEILSQMKPKGRYNIKVAEKAGVTVKLSHDIDAFYALIEKTGGRDGFTHHNKAHYRAFLEHMPGAFLLLAYAPSTTPNIPIAAVIGAIWGTTGIYYYGASDHEYRTHMAPYMLQWEAMRLCRAKGCTRYDLLGIAPVSEERGATSEATDRLPPTTYRSTHPWEGISSFKEKFGGDVVTYPPEQMIVLRPWAWRLLQMKRKMWK